MKRGVAGYEWVLVACQSGRRVREGVYCEDNSKSVVVEVDWQEEM